MKRSVLGLVCVLVMSLHASAQQDVQFSQYVFNGLTINPAYAGYKEDLYFNATYRQQWATFPGAPKTGTISLDGITNAPEERVGVGGQITWDKLGPQSSLSLTGSYAYRIPLDYDNEERLALGIGFALTQYSLDGTDYKYLDDNDPDIPLGKVTKWKPDASFGAYYSNPNTYVGLSVMNLFALPGSQKLIFGNGTTYTTLSKKRHIYLTAGTIWEVSESIALKPSILIKEDFLGPTSVDFNTFVFLSETVWAGLSYRTGMKLWNKEALQTSLNYSNALSLMLEVWATDQLRIGYSYDFNTNGVGKYQAGSHELSIGMLFRTKDREMPKMF
ncbi:type IX secretion system membrane protein, PorP/SprF family [Filimonas lacunae]|uniref:Type IX secretion system membrane protein, PorP/SprF family n=1 Tax=Filimonas lacunae TaxID=477680 RepID=A0A173MEK6_9BACT|nr:type IX secretion system membrane protein PorP/SprF [Filimonas lacunae]BAV05868.1 hypothetical protein FLA_1880 [Filimonas lacunae]SIT34594.1 type IX secretion system membrane protein, PorP/SprF family [Filimonas lacunae]